jgi:hypothetical protein
MVIQVINGSNDLTNDTTHYGHKCLLQNTIFLRAGDNIDPT